KEEVEARFLNLEQRDREKTGLIAKLKHDVSLIKKQSLQNGGNGYTDNASDDAEYRTSDSNIYQVKDNHSSILPETNHNREDTLAFDIIDDTSNSNICQETKIQLKAGSHQCFTSPIYPLSYNKDISQSSKNKVQKFIAEVSKNSSSSISNVDNDVIPTTLNETESQPSNNSFTFLYKKLSLIQRRNELASEKQIDLESNAVSRILNKEVYAQFPANISDTLLWKRIEKAKKLYKLFSTIGIDKIYQIHSFSADSISKMTNKDVQYIINNILFDYSIKIEPILKSEFSEPSSGSDQQISCKKENKDSEFSETKVTTTITSSILLSHTSNLEDKLSNNQDSDSSEVKIQMSVPNDKDSNYNYDDEDFSDNNNEDDDKDNRSFCSFSDDDEGYYYELNTSETYIKSEHRYSIHAY
ncbi:15080_t:CDS:2, partial [Cetraspora pellucida]